MISALETNNLGKRYGKRWALSNCTLQIPRGRIAGLIGLNGAGKTTLLHLAAGLLNPTEGTIHVLGEPSANIVAVLPQIGFVSQERSFYRHFTISETLMLGKKLNPSWDNARAQILVERLKLPRKQRVGKLSGGQQAQFSLLMALAKRPELLLLDEPFSHVDPLVKSELSKILMEIAAEESITIIMSSHIISELEHMCDHLVVLTASRIRIAEEMEQFLDLHKLLIGPREGFESIAKSHTVIRASHTGRQSTALVRTSLPITDSGWQAQDIALEEIVLAYLAEQESSGGQQETVQSMKEVTQ